MVRGLYVDKPGSVILREMPEPALGRDQVRIRTELAAIKHGTEFHLFSGESPFQENRFDPKLELFVPKDEPGGADPSAGSPPCSTGRPHARTPRSTIAQNRLMPHRPRGACGAGRGRW